MSSKQVAVLTCVFVSTPLCSDAGSFLDRRDPTEERRRTRVIERATRTAVKPHGAFFTPHANAAQLTPVEAARAFVERCDPQNKLEPPLRERLHQTVVHLSGLAGHARVLGPRHADDLLRTTSTFIEEYMEASNKLEAFANGRSIVTVYGSARTREDHPNRYMREQYWFAHDLAQLIAQRGLLAPKDCIVVTGGGPGIMDAAQRGANSRGFDSAFGAQIRIGAEGPSAFCLPHQSYRFRQFFARKLLMYGKAKGVVIFPGGMGTLDEMFELMTLVQTGRKEPLPIVLAETRPRNPLERVVWDLFGRGFRRKSSIKQLGKFLEGFVERGTIDASDLHIWRKAHTPAEVHNQLVRFYSHYAATMTNNGDRVVFLQPALEGRIRPKHVQRLNELYPELVKAGGRMQLERIIAGDERPQIVWPDAKGYYGHLFGLIDAINGLEL